VAEFKYLGRTQKNQNLILEEITDRLKMENAGCPAVQNLFTSHQPSKSVKIKNIQNCIFLVCFMWLSNLVSDIEERT
jgi:hypothetical protein